MTPESAETLLRVSDEAAGALWNLRENLDFLGMCQLTYHSESTSNGGADEVMKNSLVYVYPPHDPSSRIGIHEIKMILPSGANSYVSIELTQGFVELTVQKQAVALAIALHGFGGREVSIINGFMPTDDNSKEKLQLVRKHIADFTQGVPGSRYQTVLTEVLSQFYRTNGGEL